jgi:type II secretory pathway pseudopilin PulG
MQAALPATQTHLSALASALAAWSAAAAQAAAARDDRIQAAERTCAQRLQDLQSQAEEASQVYESALFDAGCAPPPDAAPQFVQFAGDTLPKPPQSWWDWIWEWLWGTASSAGAPSTVTALEGLPGIAKIGIMNEMERRITRMERTYGPNSKEEVYAARELEALKAGTLSRFYKDNPLPPRRPGFPPFVPAYQDPSIIRRAQ